MVAFAISTAAACGIGTMYVSAVQFRLQSLAESHPEYFRASVSMMIVTSLVGVIASGVATWNTRTGRWKRPLLVIIITQTVLYVVVQMLVNLGDFL